MADVLFDTDVLIDHLRGTHPIVLPRRRKRFVSVITRTGLLAGLGAQEKDVLELLRAFKDLPVDRAIADRAGHLRRHLDMRTPDAIIAATALVNRLVLFTRNVKDFRGVPGLKVESPEA